VWNWRKAFGVGQWGTPGSKAAHAATSRKGAAATHAREWTDSELDARAERAKRLGLRPNPPHLGGRPWTPKELKLLGTAEDEVIATRIGRTGEAVRCRRMRLGIPTARDRRRSHP
jgi:hypothetical protein